MSIKAMTKRYFSNWKYRPIGFSLSLVIPIVMSSFMFYGAGINTLGIVGLEMIIVLLHYVVLAPMPFPSEEGELNEDLEKYKRGDSQNGS